MLRRRRQITQRTTSTVASTVLNPYSRTSQYASSSSDNDDDDDEEEEEILLRRQKEQEEEAEQERLLSERHGEANESSSSPSSPSFKRQSDAEIANELNQTLVPKKKKPRMNLTTAQLVSPEGLIRIRHELGKIQYRPPRHDPSVRSKEKRLFKEVQASGVYLNRLIRAYERFAMDVAPNMHYSDTFRKIQDLGGKKEVRDYLNTMRQEICKEHLQKIYGKERADRFFDELEHGRQSSRDGQTGGAVVQEEEKESNDGDDDDNVDVVTNRQGDQVSKESQNDASKKVQRRRSDDSDDEEDYEASFDDVQPSIALKSVHSDAHETNKALQSTNNSSNTTIHDDQDEEEPITKQANDYGGDELSDDLEEPHAGSTNDFFGNDHTQKDDTSPSSNYEEESSSKLQEEEEEEDVHDATSMKSTNPIDIPLGTEEINKDPTSNDDTSNQVMEYFHSQEDSTHPSMFQSQENVAMTQDTAAMLGLSSSSSFSLGQTQGMSQETLVVNVTSSLTQTQPEYEATQDTLILDVSQEMGNTQNTCNDAGGSGSSGGGCSGSQDY